ncbi:DUF2313 domain-containing protein [Fusobacterium sp. IOR10]|uniref:DUF2313 domain-containing protein n=1 Tax=Fusobacterium sp. IOR10 TaxID=2665157 RepID=UPI0013D6F919|nr:DUF2313 domain-containing protein [Fusobacterium sp. IOR10]
MNNYNTLKNNIHKMFRKDEYIKEIFLSAGNKLDILNEKVDQLDRERNFDTMSLFGIATMENELAYKTQAINIEDKREEISGRWKIAGKCDLDLLQKIANSWRNGNVTVCFTDAVINIIFVSIVGIPYNLETLKFAIEEAKPAHLPIKFRIIYRTWGMLKESKKTWEHCYKFTWKELKEKEGV